MGSKKLLVIVGPVEVVDHLVYRHRVEGRVFEGQLLCTALDESNSVPEARLGLRNHPIVVFYPCRFAHLREDLLNEAPCAATHVEHVHLIELSIGICGERADDNVEARVLAASVVVLRSLRVGAVPYPILGPTVCELLTVVRGRDRHVCVEGGNLAGLVRASARCEHLRSRRSIFSWDVLACGASRSSLLI